MTFGQFKAQHGLIAPLDDHSTFSPSRTVSKRSHIQDERRQSQNFAIFQAGVREFQRLVNAGQVVDPTGEFNKQLPGPSQSTIEAQRLRRQAQELRDLAGRGMSPRKFRNHAEALDMRATQLEGAN